MLRTLNRPVTFTVLGGGKHPRAISQYTYRYQAGTGLYAAELLRTRGEEATMVYRAG